MKVFSSKVASALLAAIVLFAGASIPAAPVFAQPALPNVAVPVFSSLPLAGSEVDEVSEPRVGDVVAQNEAYTCFITGVTDGSHSQGYGFSYTTQVNPATGEGSYTLPANQRGWLDVSEEWLPDSEWAATDMVALIGWVANERHFMAQLPAGAKTVKDVYPEADRWQYFVTDYSNLPDGQVGRIYVDAEPEVVFADGFRIFRCFAPVGEEPTPTPQPTPTPSPSRTPYPDPDEETGQVLAPELGSIQGGLGGPMCTGFAYLPSLSSGDVVAAAAVDVPTSFGRPVRGVCMIAPTPYCQFDWAKLWDVMFGDLTFGDLWICGREAELEGGPVVLATVTTGTPADLLTIGGAMVVGAGSSLWTSYVIQRYTEGMELPDGAIVFDSLQEAKDWVAGQLVHPATMESTPLRVEQYVETSPDAFGPNGPYVGTIRWYQPDYEGEVTLFRGFREWLPETILTAQMLEGSGTTAQIRVESYTLMRGRHEGGAAFASVSDAEADIFGGQVVPVPPVPEAPEVEHVRNQPRLAERPKKIAGWRLAFREWFDYHAGKEGSKGPNWCGMRDDGALLIVFYAIQVFKTTGGSYKGVALILHTDGTSDSTVMSDVKPSDGNKDGGSRPKGPTFDPFDQIPCPQPFVPVT